MLSEKMLYGFFHAASFFVFESQEGCMGEVCKMTYTVNTGLLIQCGKTKIMLDSILDAGGDHFNSRTQTL